MKTCPQCHKDFEERRRPNGQTYGAKCAKCRYLAVRDWRKNTDKGRAQTLAYAHSNSHKQAHRKWLDKFPEKHAAHKLTSTAIRAGKIIKQPCQVCGNRMAQAHHADYSKPLEITWLCKIHHEMVHHA